MIRVLAIDDEPLALKLLEVYISRIPDLELVASCPSAADARPYIEAGVDAIFTDINMPDENGMHFVKSLDNPPFIVFTTAYSEYAVEGFRVDAVDYLVKPFGFKEFQEAVSKIRRRAELVAPPSEERVLFFKIGHQRKRVPLSDIIYIESLGAYLKIVLTGEDPFIVLGSLKSMGDIDPQKTVRIHKSYVINLDHVLHAGRTSVTLTGGITLPLGETYRDAFLSRYSSAGA